MSFSKHFCRQAANVSAHTAFFNSSAHLSALEVPLDPCAVAASGDLLPDARRSRRQFVASPRRFSTGPASASVGPASRLTPHLVIALNTAENSRPMTISMFLSFNLVRAAGSPRRRQPATPPVLAPMLPDPRPTTISDMVRCRAVRAARPCRRLCPAYELVTWRGRVAD